MRGFATAPLSPGTALYVLHMNAGLDPSTRRHSSHETGAGSIGSSSGSEPEFMLAGGFPRMKEQDQELPQKRSSTRFPTNLSTFRTLDIGADKVLPYMATADEENPAMGWRAIRIGLDRPGLLRLQLRALLKRSADRELRVMFPMIANVGEIERARRSPRAGHLRRHDHGSRRRARTRGHGGSAVLAVQARPPRRLADSISVGSNDLVQYLHRARPRQYARLQSL